MERIFADLGHGVDSEDEWHCEEEDSDLMFFEAGEFLDSGFGEASVGFDFDFDWDELEYNYGWD